MGEFQLNPAPSLFPSAKYPGPITPGELNSNAQTRHIILITHHFVTLSNEHKQPCRLCVGLALPVCTFLSCLTPRTSLVGHNHSDENRTP
jgi:hypothetical protein